MVKQSIPKERPGGPPPIDESWWTALLAEEEKPAASSTKAAMPSSKNKTARQQRLNWQRASAIYEQDETISLLVSGYNRGGLLVDGEDLQGFVPISHLVDIPGIKSEEERAWASFVTRWPYNLALTLKNYAFGEFDTNGWCAYWNSVTLSVWTAPIGTFVVFLGAWLLEKTRGFAWGRGVAQFMAMLPMAVPGLVLGLAYIFFFNARANPLGFIYATMAILVVNSITHFYTVSHLTATTALKQLDGEFEAVSASLKVSLWRTMSRVTVPVCLPAILDISIYLFVNAITARNMRRCLPGKIA